MEWNATFLPEGRIVVIETSGIADKEGSIGMAKSIAKTMIFHGSVRCLVDHSAIQSVTGNSFEIYDRPSLFVKLGVPFKIKIAEVVRMEHREHFAFFETVCRNRGFIFCLFDDRESALEWLRQE
jgi:hypothetical protein